MIKRSVTLGFSNISNTHLFAVCEPNPCHNGGTCHVNASSPEGYECECHPGFSGMKCESKEQ